jgi:hypothetical protein
VVSIECFDGQTLLDCLSYMCSYVLFDCLAQVLGGLVALNKKLCVITGTTSGLGLSTTRELINSGEYYVICANRDVKKMEQVAKKEG